MNEAPNVEAEFCELIEAVRVGVLITMTPEGPMGSHAPFLLGEDWTTAIVHLSGLAQHTRNLSADPRVGLFLAEGDRPDKNPLAIKRVSLQGRAELLDPASPRYPPLKERYIARFKHSEMTFGMSDFRLWELKMDSAQFVAGFGRAYRARRDAPRHWVHQRP